ncbi:MAG TPA: NUDIX hydrolase [Candidatus Limnocylindrales bacterium]|nr:NUDIX hydrolase [Candidatus Limnocylindrales bacterium]
MTYTSRSDFPDTFPDTKTQYCWQCKATGVSKVGTDPVKYQCETCSAVSDRVLIYDPNMQMYFDEQERLVHESCGVFIMRGDGKILLFQRTKFPYLLTIPAGHIEQGEEPLAAAKRESEEEVGIKADNLTVLFDGTIEGDSCLGGADIHNWHAYTQKITDGADVVLDEEGSDWGWYDRSELSSANTVQPVLYILEHS